jgi:uncharacterized protein (TIGR00251 family)
MLELKISTHGDSVHVDVQVTPRASRSALAGVHDGRLKVQLDAPPVDGAANEALIALFAKLLKVRKRDVVLVRGASSRLKTLAIAGISEQALRALIGA